MNRKEIEQMSVEEKISYLATKYMLTISQWDDKWRHYRVGINWDYKSEDGDVEFLVEKPTLDMALNDVVEVAIVGYKKWTKLEHQRKLEFMRNVKECIDIVNSDIRMNLFRYTELKQIIEKSDPMIPKHTKSSKVGEYLNKYKTYAVYKEANETAMLN